MSALADPWLPFAYAIGELSDAARNHFEARMAVDPSLCEDFLAALKLIDALQASPIRPPAPAGTPRPPRRASVFPAVTAVAVVTLMAALVRPTFSPSPDSLHDAVALSSLLRNSTQILEPAADPIDPAEPVTETLETPDWLLTAVDLDEQASTSETESPDEEEAIF
ncbi:MAG: hypothetical protein ACKO2P_10030 [Planctomycetota bacterium]